MSSEIDAIDVYWRPGCAVCQRLQWHLRSLGVPARWHNIWEDDDARQRVRRAAGGNDTVPTIVVGDRTLVAPSRAQLVATLRARAPHLVSERRRSRWPVVRVVQWVTIGSLVAASDLLTRAGHSAAGYGIDVSAVLAYLAFRRVLAPRSTVEPTAEREHSQ